MENYNVFIIVPFIAFSMAQIIKFVIESIKDRKIRLNRLFGFGGMPSGHSALTVSLTTLTIVLKGVNSFEFAISLLFTLIVLADAMGVRFETGRQAIVINDVIEELIESGEDIKRVNLKEKVGHKPIEVFAGAILGILVASAFIYFKLV